MIMGAQQSGNSNSNVCTGKDAPGMNQHCYNTGYDHGCPSTKSDVVGDAMAAFPCTLKESTNRCYAQGYTDAMKDNKHEAVGKESNITTHVVNRGNGHGVDSYGHSYGNQSGKR